MTNISRRHLFKTATAAGLAVGIPATQKAQAQVSDIRKIPKEFTAGLQSKMVYEPVPAAGIDLNTTGTFEQAASILNEGESINASHWGIMRTVVQGGRITRVKPFKFDYAPSFVLEGLFRGSHSLSDGSRKLPQRWSGFSRTPRRRPICACFLGDGSRSRR